MLTYSSINSDSRIERLLEKNLSDVGSDHGSDPGSRGPRSQGHGPQVGGEDLRRVDVDRLEEGGTHSASNEQDDDLKWFKIIFYLFFFGNYYFEKKSFRLKRIE